MCRARSAILIGSPMSSTNTWPRGAPSRAPWASAWSTSSTASGISHEIALDVGVGEGQRAAARELALEQRHDRAGGAQHVAEADGDAAHGPPSCRILPTMSSDWQ